MGSKKRVKVIRRSSGEVLVESAKWCSSRLCRLRGLQFRRGLAPGEGLVLVHDKDSVSTTSIHMFFVFFPIAAIWVDSQGVVTRTVVAKPWRPYYASPRPARYVLEASPRLLERVQPGDVLDFIPV
jgi:uncharacterized membrane protein (UPF0127 family)